uniref:Uncharacterized protein n=3 Tax=Anguilla anguilla TaxID=7936 RepID=A0A0E9U4F2_ANGAN
MFPKMTQVLFYSDWIIKVTELTINFKVKSPIGPCRKTPCSLKWFLRDCCDRKTSGQSL